MTCREKREGRLRSRSGSRSISSNSLIDNHSTMDVSSAKGKERRFPSSRKNNAPRFTTIVEEPDQSFVQEVSSFWYAVFSNVDADSISDSEASWCSSRNFCFSGEEDSNGNDDRRNPTATSRRKARECDDNSLRMKVETSQKSRRPSLVDDGKLNRNSNKEKNIKKSSSAAVVADDKEYWSPTNKTVRLRGDRERIVNRFQQYKNRNSNEEAHRQKFSSAAVVPDDKEYTSPTNKTDRLRDDYERIVNRFQQFKNRNPNEEAHTKKCSSAAVVADDKEYTSPTNKTVRLRGDRERIANRFQQYINGMQDEIKQRKETQQQITNENNTLSSHNHDWNDNCNSTIQTNECSTIFTFDENNHRTQTPPRFVVDSRLADLKTLPRLVEGEEDDNNYLANTFGGSYGGDNWSVTCAPPPSMASVSLNPHTTNISIGIPHNVTNSSLNVISPPSVRNTPVISSTTKTLFVAKNMTNTSMKSPSSVKTRSITGPLNPGTANSSSIVLPPTARTASLKTPEKMTNTSVNQFTTDTPVATRSNVSINLNRTGVDIDNAANDAAQSRDNDNVTSMDKGLSAPVDDSGPDHIKPRSQASTQSYNLEENSILGTVIIDKLRKYLPHNFQLIYSMVRDGANLQTVLEKTKLCAHTTLIVVETADGDTFGAFTAKPWNVTRKFHTGPESFLWRLRKQQGSSCIGGDDVDDFELYPFTGKNPEVHFCNMDKVAAAIKNLGRSYGNGDSVSKSSAASSSQLELIEWGFGLAFQHDLRLGTSSPCVNFNSPSLSQKARFVVSNIECFTIAS